MSDRYYKEQLYPLQDRVLHAIGSIRSPFYLTGGTLLGRFLLHHRHSDDLDFFVNAHPTFSAEVERAADALKSAFDELRIGSRQDSFARFYVVDQGVELKLEFINDVPYRVGLPVEENDLVMFDTWMNVLVNKVTALSRGAAKDIVDIYFLSLSYAFSWEEVIAHAKGKDAWVNEIDVSKSLHDFDLRRLQEVSFPNQQPPGIAQPDLVSLARDALHGFDNSLFGRSGS